MRMPFCFGIWSEVVCDFGIRNEDFDVFDNSGRVSWSFGFVLRFLRYWGFGVRILVLSWIWGKDCGDVGEWG